MAENTKRPNAGGKPPVATPNVAPQGMVSMENALSGAIGARIRLQTTVSAHPTLEGTLFTICPLTNLIAISTTPPKSTHHVLPLSSLTSFTLLSPAPALPTPLPPQNTSTLLARANAALARAQEKAARINKSVGKEAQELFDGLHKQFPGTRWDGKDIIVLDAVLIKGPGYKAEDCRAGNKEGAGALTRVKKVLENERKRLAHRDSKPVKPFVPAIPAIPAFSGQRKGG